MNKLRKSLAGITALLMMLAAVPQAASACEVQINTKHKYECSVSYYEDAVEITDEFIVNDYIHSRFRDDVFINGIFKINDGAEHRVFAHDSMYTNNHQERNPQFFYLTFDHYNEIRLVHSEDTDWSEFYQTVDDFVSEKNIPGAFVDDRIGGTLVCGFDGVDEKLAEEISEMLEEKGMLRSVTFTPSYSDAMKIVMSMRYPYRYTPVINRLITGLGLSRTNVYVDVSRGAAEIKYNPGRVTQKQMTELAAAIYRETGYISDGDPERYNGDTSLVWINDLLTDAESYTLDSGLRVRNQGYAAYYRDAVKITDDRITAFYRELIEKTRPTFSDSPDWGELNDFYVYDSVKYDNSILNGEWLNRELLDSQILAMHDFPSYLNLNINEKNTDELGRTLDEKFGLTEKNVRIITYTNNMDIRGFYSEMTEELADSIFKELKSMGYSVSGEFYTSGLSDGMIAESPSIPFEYPVSRQEEIMSIVSESGLKSKVQPCIHYTDDSDYFDIIFDDVYNTTQMELVKLRTEIYEKTGECGLVNAGEFKPEYKGCLQFSVTDSVTAPGRTTYADIKLGQNTGFYSFITDIDYDHDNLELVSVSLKKELEDDIDFFVSDNRSRILLSNSRPRNIEMNNEAVIRLAFRVKDDAPDGKYEIGLKAAENNESGVCMINDSMVEWVKSEFSPGYITVDSNAVPKTQTKPMPLNRMYAVIKDGDKVSESALTGDINNDGVFNVMDVMRLKRYFVGTDKTVSNADTNEDGVVNVADLLILSSGVLNGD